MSESYELVRERLPDGGQVLVLAPIGGKSFLEEMTTPKKRGRLESIAATLERVIRNGTRWALASGTMKPLDTTVSVFEVRLRGKVIRVMAYVHDDVAMTPVMLFDFDGHQGGDKISSRHLERAARLAVAARECMIEEFGDKEDAR